MTICVNCGEKAENCLCDSCRHTVNLEKLCHEIVEYHPGIGENPLWENICSGFSRTDDFKHIAFALSYELPSPKREYIQILSIAGSATNVPKISRPWFYDMYNKIKDSEGLTDTEKNHLAGIAVGAYYMDYEYEKAEEIAHALCNSKEIPWQAGCNLADYFTTTRRYDSADEVIEDILKRFKTNSMVVESIYKKAEKNAKQREKMISGKQEYLPAPRENGDEIRKRYIDFLATLGINVSISSISAKTVIPKDQYLAPIETRDVDFDTFVAFDIETTGKNPMYDSIIEIGAVKVVDGVIAETEEFTFQELVQPLDSKKVSSEITKLTGITNEEVYAARPIWEVMPDFMKFVGDSVLVGFNCMSFDSKFMVRAGRYSNIFIENRYFDVIHYVNQFKDKLGIESKSISLNKLAAKLGIENPRAHRAYADALTTAGIFLKLKEMEEGESSTSVEDMLADLDNW